MPRKKEEKKRDVLGRWTNAWLITVNTQRSEVEFIEILRGAWKIVIEHLGSNFLKYREGGSLIRVREKHAIERGEIYKRIHLHSSLVVEGYGLIMLDYEGIKRALNQIIREYVKGFRGVYFNAKLVKNYNATVLINEYLEKAPL